MTEARHFIPYGSYFAPCDYIADQRFPGRHTERRAEVTCGECQSRMTNLGDLPEIVLAGADQ